MSVGLPLYSGHLMMLAGFTSDGDPIVHDPWPTNGYSRLYNKMELSQSWFEKGGISYTFYPADSQAVSIDAGGYLAVQPQEFTLYQNYPNPFNPSTVIRYRLLTATSVRLDVYNGLGQLVSNLVNEMQSSGDYSLTFNGEGLASGVYFYKLSTGGKSIVRRMILQR